MTEERQFRYEFDMIGYYKYDSSFNVLC